MYTTTSSETPAEGQDSATLSTSSSEVSASPSFEEQDAAFLASVEAKMSGGTGAPPATQPAAGAQPGQQGQPTPAAKPGETPAADSAPFQPITYKANGKEFQVTTREELMSKLSQAHGATQQMAEAKAMQNEYRALESEIKKDPAMGQALGLLTNMPGLRAEFLQMVNNKIAKKEIHPSEIEASVLKRQNEQREVQDRETSEEQTRTQERETLTSHLTEIAKDLPKELFPNGMTQEYYNTLRQLMKERGIRDIRDARKLHMAESGELDKLREAKEQGATDSAADRQRKANARIRQGAGFPPAGVAPKPANPADEEQAFLERIAKKTGLPIE